MRAVLKKTLRCQRPTTQVGLLGAVSVWNHMFLLTARSIVIQNQSPVHLSLHQLDLVQVLDLALSLNPNQAHQIRDLRVQQKVLSLHPAQTVNQNERKNAKAMSGSIALEPLSGELG